MRFKHPHTLTDTTLTLTLDSGTHQLNAIFDASDASLLAGKRLRLISGRVVTTHQNAKGQEVGLDVDHFLLGVPATTIVLHRDNDLLNFRRDNLSTRKNPPRQKRNSFFYVADGSTAFLVLDGGLTVLVDAVKVPQLSEHHWRLRQDSNRRRIITTKDRQQIELARFIVGSDAEYVANVRHANLDSTDYRRSNLLVEWHNEKLKRSQGRGGRPVLKGRTHCNYGHPLTPENIYTSPAGSELCRECNRERWRAYAERKRQGIKPNKGKRTECRNGHPWVAANLYTAKSGSKVCKICRRETYQRYQEKKNGSQH